MKTIIKIICFIILCISLHSCVVYPNDYYSYPNYRVYHTHRVYYNTPHHHQHKTYKPQPKHNQHRPHHKR